MSNAMTETVKQYEAIVVALEDPMIIKTAMRLAYYSAILDAALDDPLDSQDDHDHLVAWFRQEIHFATENFQRLVNDRL